MHSDAVCWCWCGDARVSLGVRMLCPSGLVSARCCCALTGEGVPGGQLAALRTLSQRAGQCPVLLLNAEWDPDNVPAGQQQLVDSFEVR
jgi:hypothetical protein